MRISVSGTIGAGKSTLCENLSGPMGYEVFSEPVEDNPYLEDFYRDTKRWAFDAQVFMISHRFRRQMEAVHAASGRGFLLDRCFHEDRVFAEVNHKLGNISDRDWSTYLHLYESFCRVVPPPEFVVYLRTDPAKARERIESRGRESEKAISMDYMVMLNESYEAWVTHMKGKTRVLEVPWDDFDSPGWSGVVDLLVDSGASMF